MLITLNPALLKGPSRLSSDFSDFDSLHQKLPVPIRGFKGLSRITISSAVVFYPFWAIFDVKTEKIETLVLVILRESSNVINVMIVIYTL